MVRIAQPALPLLIILAVTNDVSLTVERVYRAESRHVFATLVRLLGDWDLAEDATSDAFAMAIKQWPDDGVPDNPRAWLVSTGRFKAIDTIRRRALHARAVEELSSRAEISEFESTAEHEVIDR